tara:strand:+ start:1422 stop:2348 length:927 start_codon:yes stop_codon:yes gene_type:complete
MSINILIVDPIHQQALDYLSNKYNVINEIHPTRNSLISLIKNNIDVLIIRSGVKLDEEIINQANNLKLIARAGSGMDNIPVDYCTSKNIKVFNIPNTSYSSVSEFTFGLIISLIRKINIADSQVKKNVWRKSELYGNSLYGKNIGVVGLGKIGSYVAQIAKGFNLNILASVENDDKERRESLKKQNIELVELDYLLKNSDIVTLHLPLTNSTKYLISKKKIEIMKRSSFLINLSRGQVVNEKDLIYCLKNNFIAGYASDVFEHEREKSELFKLNNTVFTPHIGAMTYEAQEKIGEILIRKIDQFIENG